MACGRVLRRLGALGLLGALALTACSGGSDSAAPDDAGSAPTASETPASTTTVSSQSETTTTAAPDFPPYTTANTPIGVLVDDPLAFEVLERHLPPAFSAPETLELIRGTSLKGIQGYGADVLTDDVLAQIDAELAELTPVSGEVIAGNYDEVNVRPYVLPDPLVLANGDPVDDAETWWSERRPEIFDLYESLVYGRAPGRPERQHFEVTESATPAVGGKALRTQVAIHLSDEDGGPVIDLVVYVPAAATGPVPMLLVLGFGQLDETFGDLEGLLGAGFGVAGIDYLQLDPDREDGGYAESVRAYFDEVDETDRAPDAWGATAAWGWGLSRAQDYLETDPMVDADRVAIFGASRLGRGVLWAAARDERFAAVIACCSGKLGASLLRRNFGDALGESVYYVAPNFADYVGDVDTLPVDSHMLLSLIAPRGVLLQTGRYDHAADPKGEFLAAVAASPVYELLGADGLGAAESAWPVSEPILSDIGYHMHDGGHGPAPGDWEIFIEFLRAQLQPNE